MQKSLVFKEKFKHIHHPGQTKYSMSVGIGCLSHLFAVSVPGQGSAVKARFFFFFFCLSADKCSSRWGRQCKRPASLGWITGIGHGHTVGREEG